MITGRIKELIDTLGLSVNGFSKKIGLPQTTVDNQLRGVRKMSLSTIEAILAAFDTLSAEWLMRGKGKMFMEIETNAQIAETILPLTQTITILRDTIEAQQETINQLKEKLHEL